MKILSFFILLWMAMAGANVVCLYAASTQESKAVFEEGLRLKESGRWESAEHKFKQVLELDPADAHAHFELGGLYASRFDRTGRFASKEEAAALLNAAAREFEQAVMLAPDFVAGHYNLGIVHKRLGRYEEAREDFRRVLELDSRQTNARLQIGAIYEEQGFFDEAESVYREAEEMDFGNPDARSALEDLPRNREIARERMNIPSLSAGPAPSANADFGMGSSDQAANLDQKQALAQLAPQLGSWLMQKFAKNKSND